MVAYIQRLIVVSGASVSCLWAWFCIAHQLETWAPAAVLLLMAGYASVIGIEFVFLAASSWADEGIRPKMGALVFAWFAEIAYSPRVFLWRQPFRATALADSNGADDANRRGVVFIHGFFCNRGFWNSWLQEFRQRRLPFVAVTLEPAFGSIDGYAAAIDIAVCRLSRITGQVPVLVAHSMGGLAVRAWLAGDVENAARVHRVVTIGSPHFGTKLATFGHARNARQMAVGNPWLRSLEARESTGGWRNFVCFWSRCDNIVFPARNATLPGADNRELDGTPHVRMAAHPAVRTEVLRLIGASESFA